MVDLKKGSVYGVLVGDMDFCKIYDFDEYVVRVKECEVKEKDEVKVCYEVKFVGKKYYKLFIGDEIFIFVC